jgi:hypothetical protein
MPGEFFNSFIMRTFKLGTKLARPARFVMSLAATMMLLGCANSKQPDYYESQSPPPQARLSLQTDKASYFIGETIDAKFVIKNIGKPFRVSWGGDYRMAVRPDRFRVKAIGPDGKIARDPYPGSMSMGGIMGGGTIAPGDIEELSVPIARYCLFEKPGKYTITVSHDLGWTPGVSTPSAITEILIKEPTPEDAERIIQQMEKRLKSAGEDFRRKMATQEQSDFAVMRHPAYLQPLMRYARGGSISATQGITSIYTPKATQALIELLPKATGEQKEFIVIELSKRVPLPPIAPLVERLGICWLRVEESSMTRRDVSRASWQASFADKLRPAALALPATPQTRTECQTMTLLTALLRLKDEAFLIRQLNDSLKASLTLPFEHDSYPRTRGSWYGWRDAARIWIAQGFPVSGSLATPGEQAMFLIAFGEHSEFRNPDRTGQALRLLADPVPAIRELAVASLPPEVILSAPDRFKPCFYDADIGVRIAAAETVHRHGIQSLVPALEDMVRLAPESWALEIGSYALIKLGHPLRSAEILAEKIGDKDPKVRLAACGALIGNFGDYDNNPQGLGMPGNISDDERISLQKKWVRFVRSYSKEISTGKRINRGKMPLTSGWLPASLFHR